MRRWLPWVGLAVVVAVSLAVATRSAGPAGPAARAARIDAEVKCPQCSGQSALASNAPAARAVREFVAQQVQAGQSDATIETALRDRYGDDILLRPPASGLGGLVWQIPVAVFCIAAGGLAIAFRKWRPRPPGRVSTEDRALVDRALVDRALSEPPLSEPPLSEPPLSEPALSEPADHE